MIPVLDKGFVSIVSASCSGDILNNVATEFTRGKLIPQLLTIPTLTLKIKCPLFVQLFIAENNISFLTKKGQQEIEAYVPTEVEIAGPDIETNRAIQSNIAQTTAALLINPKAYQADNCDHFISQIVSPISVYNEIVATGNLSQWIDIAATRNLPRPIEAYRKAIHSAMEAEWPHINEYIRLAKR